MLDIEQQLAQLKQRIATINRKYAEEARVSVAAFEAEPVPCCLTEHWPGSRVVASDAGEHLEAEKLFPRHKNHGSADVGALSELPQDLLDALGEGEVPVSNPQRWAFLDTETTGLAGGSGTYAFLIGVGRITQDGFTVRQFFMREYAEEKSLLMALADHLSEFDVVITYNGRSYDQPLLETRYRMTRQKPPFERLAHLDLLYGARRLWKLRLESCRLMQLEQQVLGYMRDGDVPGELIPYLYFDYLRSRAAQRMLPVFHHNAMDILTLACLTAIVPTAFRATDPESLARVGVRRGEDLIGIARWLLAAGEQEQALALLKRAVKVGLPDGLLFRSLWDIALIEKRLGRPQAALALFTELAGCRNEYRVSSLEELAKYYEHEERNYTLALEFTAEALSYGCSEALQHRRERLERRLERGRRERRIFALEAPAPAPRRRASGRRRARGPAL